MNKYFKYMVSVAGLALLLFAGCSDRGTNIPDDADISYVDTPQDVKLVKGVHDFYPELNFQIRNEYRLQEIATYIPTVSFPPPYGPSTEVPLLILLPPQDGDQYYYFNHGLQQLADEMIANGEIQPMIISCISNDKVFGGYFYSGGVASSEYFGDDIFGTTGIHSGSPHAGALDDIIGRSLVDYLNTSFPLINSPAQRGIGGVGMGAYGAFRAAILNPGQFTSISATDGPLDFDGADGSSGLIDLFDDAMTEQGLDFSSFKQFDTSGTWHISRLFIGGAFAFSPQDTTLFWERTGSTLFVIDSTWQISDTTTLISKFRNKGHEVNYLLPFDGNANAYMPIWNLWLDNNLETLLDNYINDFGWHALGGVEIMVTSTEEARYGYHEMTQSFINTLRQPPHSYNVKEVNYTGYDGNPATHDQYLYETMRKMLIFHSENFGTK